MGAVGCKHTRNGFPPLLLALHAKRAVALACAVEASEIQARRRDERRQPGDEIQWLEDYMGRPVTVRGFQCVADLTACGQEQALF